MTRIFDFFKGTISLAVTAALLFAVPAFVGPWSLDRGSDLIDALTDELTSEATLIETLLTGGLLIVFWLAWAMLAVAIITEAAALARGRVARRLPVFPGIQGAAQRLVASCALVITTFTAIAPAAAAPTLTPLANPITTPHAAVLVVDDTTADTTATIFNDIATADTATTASASSTATYEVRHGDTWWSMAEQFLGDGMLWEQLLATNDGAVMADGKVITPATDSVRAGWIISLPSDAVLPLELTTPAAAGDALEVAQVETDEAPDLIEVGDTDETWDVQRGDHFWQIADDALTEAWDRAPTDAEIQPFWTELLDLNADRLLPPDDPNMVYPDQVFALPEIPADPQAPQIGAIDLEPADETAPTEIEIPAEADTEVTDPPIAAQPPTVGEIPIEDTSTVTDATAPADTADQTTPATAAQPTPAVPADSTSEPSTNAATTPGPDSITPSPTSAVPVPAGAQIAAEPVTADPAAVADPEADSDGTADAEDVGDAAGFPVMLVTGLGLLAAGLTAAVRRLRARRVSERRPGTAPVFKAPTPPETEITRLADADTLNEINTAMRYLGAKLEGRPNPPGIVGVSVAQDRLSILLDRADPNAPAPFTPETNTWVIERPITVQTPTGAIAPVPALTTIGYNAKQEFMLDLEHASIVNLTGTRSDVAATMSTMALELAVSPIADQIDIICIGLSNDLAALERITVADSVAEVADRLERHVDDVAEVLDHDDVGTAVTGRVNDVAGDTWTPVIVFAPDATHESDLLELARRTNGSGVTALVTADGQATWQMHLKEDGRLQIPHIGVVMKRANLTPEQLTAACNLVDDARTPETVDVVDLVAEIDTNPEPETSQPSPETDTTIHPWDEPTSEIELTAPLAPAPPLPEVAPPSWDDVDYWVEILGTVRVVNTTGAEMSFERAAGPQLLAYLTQYRHGVTMDTATEAIYPNREPSKQRMYNLSSDIRSVLGTDPAGDPYLPKVTKGMMHVSDRVGTDYERLCDLVNYASDVGGSDALEALRTALELVRGDPFTGRGLDWAATTGIYTEVTVAVDEAARTMASIALDKLDRPEDAVWATQQGLIVSPRSTELHLLRLRAVLARDDAGIEPDAVWQHYVTVMEEEDDLPEGGSNLDDRMVDLYESYRRSNPRRWAAEAPTG